MEESLSRLLMKISAYSIFLPIIFALIRIENGNRQQKVLSILIFLSAFVELMALIIGQGFHLPNLPIFHAFTIFEFGIILYLFQVLLKEYFPEWVIKFWLIAFTSFAILNGIFWDGIFNFNATARSIESLFIIILSLLYFYNTLKNMNTKYLEQTPLFWISSGLLLYFSTSLFVAIYSNYFMDSQEISFTIWGIHAFLNMVLNLFYFIALWINPKI